MSKGEQTRQLILERAALLFNRQGYFGASMGDIMRETGLEKGGIYNHFRSKEELALEAFDYAFELMRARLVAALEGKRHAIERLLATVSVFRTLAYDPPLKGGCVVLNTAIEADDAQPELRSKALAAVEEWRNSIRHITNKGIERGEIKPDVDGDELASLLIASLEGAVMLSQLYRHGQHMARVVDHLTAHIETLRA